MELEQWLKDAESHLVKVWGLKRAFAGRIALFLAYLADYGISYTITSGFRSQKKQRELKRRWEAGDPSVVVRPADDSLHSKTAFLRPAAEAVDIKTSSPYYAALIAQAIGIGAGYFFRKPDPVHFFER